MVRSWKIVKLTKYIFLALLITAASFLMADLFVRKPVGKIKGQVTNELVYKPKLNLFDGALSELDENFLQCLTNPGKGFCLMTAKKKLELLHEEGHPVLPYLKEIENHFSNGEWTDHTLPWNKLLLQLGTMLESVNVSLILIEPSLIYCMLSPANKLLALENGFIPSKLEGFKDVITLAVLEDDYEVLKKEETVENLLSSGFQIFRTRKWNDANVKSSEQFDLKMDPFYTSHYLIYQYHLIFHIIILYRRGTFLWHAGLFEEDLGFKDLLFVKEGAYENFTAVSLKSSPKLGIYLPSDPLEFLLQLQNAEFRECLPGSLGLFPISPVPLHPLLTDEQLQLRVLIVIQELKTRLRPYNVLFWIWSRTLLGWYYKCSIFEYTKSLHLAFASDFNLANLNLTFSNSEYWTLDEIIESDGQYLELRLDCHSLKIRVFIIHRKDNSVWYRVNSQDQNKAIRYMSPKFDLCSTNLYGQKIHVPCEPKGILDTEFLSNGTSLFTASE